MRLIVTRPQPEAQRWVEGLTEAGFEALALPLITLAPIRDQTALHSCWSQLADYQAVMFVSASAVEHFFAARSHQEFKPRAWATGPATRVALLRVGVTSNQIDAPAADAAQFDSEALWQVVAPNLRPEQRILIVRGADGSNPAQGVGREWLAQSLRQSSVEVDFVVAYQRGLPQLGPQDLQLASQAASDGSVWIFSSSQAVAHLQALLPQQNWSSAKALASHGRIAAAARTAGFAVVLESRPSLPDLVSSLKFLR